MKGMKSGIMSIGEMKYPRAPAMMSFAFVGVSLSMIAKKSQSAFSIRSRPAASAGAGGAAHLPGMTAAKTSLPVLGVPVESKALKGMDSLLSIVQMPAGVPVATFAIGRAGAVNAALFAVSILANKYPECKAAIEEFRRKQTDTVLLNPDPRGQV